MMQPEEASEQEFESHTVVDPKSTLHALKELVSMLVTTYQRHECELRKREEADAGTLSIYEVS